MEEGLKIYTAQHSTYHKPINKRVHTFTGQVFQGLECIHETEHVAAEHLARGWARDWIRRNFPPTTGWSEPLDQDTFVVTRLNAMDTPLAYMAATCGELQARLGTSGAQAHLRTAEQTLQNVRRMIQAAIQDLTRGSK